MKGGSINRASLTLFFLENAIWLIVIAFYAVFAFLVPIGMLDPGMVLYIIFSCFPVGFIVLGQAICLITGNFDLSIGEIAGLAATIGALVACSRILPDPLTLFIPVIVGVLCGLVNGLLITGLDLHPFLLTLGTGFAYDGLTLLIYPTVIFSGFPDIYLAVGGEFSWSFPIFFGILVTFAFILTRFRMGVRFYAVGSDPVAASMTGINSKRITLLAYTLSGMFGGLSGLFYAGYQHSVSPGLTAADTVFISFAAAVLGGVSIRGGRGNIINVLGGILCLTMLDYGLTMLKINPYARRVAYGLLVVIALVVDKVRASVRERYMRSLRKGYEKKEFE
jgi:ribose/xylose/arabinose/galactoside ABC-type transport system permease subunit